MKGEKDAHRPHHISIPAKDAIAIVPPKKVCSQPCQPCQPCHPFHSAANQLPFTPVNTPPQLPKQAARARS